MWNVLKSFVLWTNLLIVLVECAAAKDDSDVIHSKKPNALSDYKQYIDDDFARFPKCCPNKSALVQTNETLECSTISIRYEHFELSSTNTSTAISYGNYLDNCDSVDCVDFLQNGTEWSLVRMQNCMVKTIYRQYMLFPKCCPIDFAYDMKKHKCVQQDDKIFSFGGYLQVVNVSLSHCFGASEAIADFDEAFTIDSDALSVELESGKTFNYSNYCIDRNAESGSDVIRACLKYEDVCGKNGRRCLRKCCPDGEIYISNKKNKPTCTTYYTEGFDVENNTRINHTSDYNYAVINGLVGTKYLSKAVHQYFIDDTGRFHIYRNNDWEILEPKDAFYCIESWIYTNSSPVQQYNYLSIQKDPANIEWLKFNIQGVILAISCILLLVTIVCYIYLPETQNVHGKSILMFCLFLFVGCITLCFLQLNGPVMSHGLCVSLGFTVVFTFLGSFAWMNVICFDMWMAFGTMRVLDVQNKRKEMKKFIYYNLYAWGVPITICGMALIVYNTECLPPAFVPHIGRTKCYFDKHENYDYLIYFIIPEVTMILINWVYFIKTAIYCVKVKNEIQRMRSVNGTDKEKKRNRYNDDKDKLVMLLKLFLVMGIPWTFEVISTFISFKETLALQIIETVCDSINCAEGIIIFCIFILKKRVLHSFKKRFGMLPQRRISEYSSTGTTNISGMNGNANKNENDVQTNI